MKEHFLLLPHPQHFLCDFHFLNIDKGVMQGPPLSHMPLGGSRREGGLPDACKFLFSGLHRMLVGDILSFRVIL